MQKSIQNLLWVFFLKLTLLNKHVQLLIPNFVDNIACSMESLNQFVTWKYFPDLGNLGFSLKINTFLKIIFKFKFAL